jgi:hypothetical protein
MSSPVDATKVNAQGKNRNGLHLLEGEGEGEHGGQGQG